MTMHSRWWKDQIGLGIAVAVAALLWVLVLAPLWPAVVWLWEVMPW